MIRLATFSVQVGTGLAFSYCLLSFIEWYIHKFHMHRRGWINRFAPDFFRHHQGVHHPAYRADFRSPDPEDHRFVGVDSTPADMAVAAVPIAAVIALAWPAAAAGFFALAMAHTFFWTEFHREMHSPAGRWACRNAWYRACLRHHELHHRFPRTNFCGLFLGADRFLGTACRNRPPCAPPSSPSS